MVLEMLDLSRLEAGKVKLSRDQVSLLTLAQYMVEKLEKPIAEKQLQVEFLTQEEGLITADESRMAQVMENFFTNAVKYTPKGGWIQVELERGRREITFTLKNQSQPLSQEELHQVWDPFFRAKDAQMEEGTGLGLAIVKTIIELHGGCLLYTSVAAAKLHHQPQYLPAGQRQGEPPCQNPVGKGRPGGGLGLGVPGDPRFHWHPLLFHHRQFPD